MPFDLFDTSASYGLLRQDGLTVSLTKALRTKRYVMLYIASQWWAPCRGVTAQLQSFYKAHHGSHAFEVIFLSTDRSKEAMLSCFHNTHGDWLCLDYADARRLEAELAADADLHPKQVPACLVFELTHPRQPYADAVSARPSAAVGSAEPGHLEGAPFVSCAADTCGRTTAAATAAAASFARLVTKHGREMLSKDKAAALFPWHDDGWSDAESVRSAVLTALPQSQEGLSPEKTAAPPLQTSSPTPSAPPKEASGGACEQREESSAPPPSPQPTSAPSHESGRGDTNSVPTPLSSPTTPHLLLHHRPKHIGGRPGAQNGAAGAAGKDVVEGSHHHPDSAGARRGVILIRRTQAPSRVAQAVVTAEAASADD